MEWSEPKTVTHRENLFVNWADFPSAVALSNGTLAAHWLEINGDAAYQYDVKIAMSNDDGKTWGDPFIPHEDRSQREHGFVTLLPGQDGALTAIWLDGRNYDTYASQDVVENAMQLRARAINSEGAMKSDSLLDARTCTCCQTSAVITEKDSILVVYRDRSPGEIRDISIVRKAEGEWSAPYSVAQDGWHIEGCPVNGPAIDAKRGRTVVAWFTAADNVNSP